MRASVGEEGNERALTRLCVVLGCGEGWSVGFGRGGFDGGDVGFDGVQEGLAGGHVEGRRDDVWLRLMNVSFSFTAAESLSLPFEHDEDDVLAPLSFPHYVRLSSSMFHISTDRLAGLDTMILKITAPSKVPTLIPHHSLHHDTYRIPVRKLKKQKPHREARPPLADKTASNNLVCNSTTPFRPPVHLPPFRLPARLIQRVPCTCTLFLPQARSSSSPPMIPLLHVFRVHPIYPPSAPSLLSPRLRPSSCRRSSISLPSPLTRLQIPPLVVRPPLFQHLSSFAPLPPQLLPHAM